MPTFRMDLTWDGGEYSGWQRQPNTRTIQETVEQALQIIFPNETIVLQGAGRTDAGVHALQQVASFSIKGYRTPTLIVRGLNAKLPKDIVCTHIEQVADGFNPRYHSKEKMYRYRILMSELPCPFRYRYTWHVQRTLDVELMQQLAEIFVGTHNFDAFRAQGCSAKSTHRTITRSEIRLEGDELHFEVQGKGFLRHMVRIMTGSLVAVGDGKRSPQQIQRALRHPERSLLGQTAPAHGLWLVWTSLLDNEDKTE